MSFICSACHRPTQPGIKPVVHPVTRTMSYSKVDPETKQVMPDASVGFETVKELKLCPLCADVKQAPEVTADYTKMVAIAKGYHAHAANCVGTQTVKVRQADGSVEKVKEPCHVCARIVENFAGFPLSALAASLEDKRSAPYKQPLWLLAVEGLLERVKHNTKRATRDRDASFPLLSSFEARVRASQGRGHA